MQRKPNPNRRGDARRGPAGFSLVEAVVAIVFVALLLVAALQTVGGSAKAQATTERRALAMMLAQELMSDVLALSYEDPDTVVFGIETGESSGSRKDLDDVDDFNGWTESPPEDRDGDARTRFSGWTRAVTVARVDEADLLTELTSETGIKKVTVTVSRGGIVYAELTALRTEP